jgi:uncharacterized protein YjeT (DUF2065 family)
MLVLLADGGSVAVAAAAIGVVMVVPGLLGLVVPALADEHTRAAARVPALSRDPP